jgi:hypothetical protein
MYTPNLRARKQEEAGGTRVIRNTVTARHCSSSVLLVFKQKKESVWTYITKERDIKAYILYSG